MIYRTLAVAVVGAALSFCASAQTPCLPPAVDVMTVVFPASVPFAGGPALHSGDVIQAHDPRGQCVGELVWSETEGRALALRGDDPTTAEVDGLVLGERVELSVTLPDGILSVYAEAATLSGDDVPDITFATGSILVAGVLTSHAVATDAPTAPMPALALSAPAPNPASTSTNLTYTLGTEATVRAEIVDVVGRRVREVVIGSRLSGDHQLVLGVGEIASGIYVVRLHASGSAGAAVAVARLTVVR